MFHLLVQGNFGVSNSQHIVDFSIGDSVAFLDIDTVADDLTESNGTITASIEIGEGYEVSSTDYSAEATVYDASAALTIALTAVTESVVEGSQ